MSDLLLGKDVAYDADYDPSLLCPIPRAPGRQALNIENGLPFRGCDIWTAYELSWLNPQGKPMVACAEIRIPCDSPNIVESKSLKLYLNSFNQHTFMSAEQVRDTIAADLTTCVGVRPHVVVLLPEQWDYLQCSQPLGFCLDDVDVSIRDYQPDASLLTVDSKNIVRETVFSRLLRSRCPVTGQPDWATLQIEYAGPAIDHAALLAYIVSYRLHQDFHEHCIERIFVDVMQACSPQQLTVYARYLRRGGIDINPYRSNTEATPPMLRCFRQ